MEGRLGGGSSVSLLVPESPALDSGYLTPEIHAAEGGPSKLPRPDGIPTSPMPLLDFSSSSILTRLEDEHAHGDPETPLRISLILQHALRYALEHADNDLLSLLLALGEPWAGPLDEVAREMEGDDGWGVVGMAIASSSGRQEKEEGVRAVVSRWGVHFGVHGGRDNSGWTALHLAALISTPPLISFLLTRGASPHAENDRGSTPLDLVSGMDTRANATILLENATSTGTSRGPTPLPSEESRVSGRRREMLQKRRRRVADDAKRSEEQERQDRMTKEKEDWVKGLMKVVDVDAGLLFPPKPPRKRGWVDEDEGQVAGDPGEESFEVTAPARIDDTSLAWGPSNLPHILDTFISSYRPICQPLDRRALPANALYLYARFAHYHCDESWLDELLIGALDRIEEAVYKNVDDLAFLAFWTYNTTLLLYLIRSDAALAQAAEKLIVQLEELANAIHVFIIRIGERKVDTVLDEALLDYETLEDFDDVRFEGEWTLFRSFGAKKQRSERPSVLPKAASSVFGSPGTGGEPASPSLLGTIKGKIDSSPFKVPQSKTSLADLRSASLDTAHNALFGVTTSTSSPRTVTEMLSAALVVLQLYDVNPAITIQAFSQIFFWIACELFNRILTRKKYLCRTKAVQIRMNITALEDWVRTHGLPIRTVTQHFEPVTQLLQWLQCQSALANFDDLISTLQNMRAINPLQMRRTVRDYRWEVNEGRMDEECAQYLAQLQKDWEKRKAQMSIDASMAAASAKEAAAAAAVRDSPKQSFKPLRQSSADDLDDPAVYAHPSLPPTEAPTPIDLLFDPTLSLADFIPQGAPDTMEELLDSRFMLPFHLPQDPSLLIATPPADAAYAVAFPPGTFTFDGHRSSRPPSRASFLSSRPMGYALPGARGIRELPDDFFGWLKDQEKDRRQRREESKAPVELHRANTNPLGESSKPNLPAAPIATPSRITPMPGKLAVVEEDESTPIATGIPISSSAPAFPSLGLATSGSIDQLREQSRTSWNPSPPGAFAKTRDRDSYELSPVATPSRATFASNPAIPGDGASMTSSVSNESMGSVGKMKRWFKLGRKASQADLREESEMVGLGSKRRVEG